MSFYQNFDETNNSSNNNNNNNRQKFVPVLIGALGRIKKELDQNLQLLPGHPSAVELQEIKLMSTAHVILKCCGKSL